MHTKIQSDDQRRPGFRDEFSRLSEKTRNDKTVTNELKIIVKNGLRIANKTDEICKQNGTATKSCLYLLHKVIFELWSYQHQNILDTIVRPGNLLNPSNNDEYSIFFRHQTLGLDILNDFQILVNLENAEELTDQLFIFWKKYISYLVEFSEIPIVRKKQKLSGFSSGLSGISPQTSYAIFTTILFLLGIIIATFILIQG